MRRNLGVRLYNSRGDSLVGADRVGGLPPNTRDMVVPNMRDGWVRWEWEFVAPPGVTHGLPAFYEYVTNLTAMPQVELADLAIIEEEESSRAATSKWLPHYPNKNESYCNATARGVKSSLSESSMSLDSADPWRQGHTRQLVAALATTSFPIALTHPTTRLHMSLHCASCAYLVYVQPGH